MKRINLIALAVALLIAAPASAYTIAAAGDTFSVALGGNVNGSAVPGLTADAQFTVASYTQDLVRGYDPGRPGHHADQHQRLEHLAELAPQRARLRFELGDLRRFCQRLVRKRRSGRSVPERFRRDRHLCD